MRNKPTTLPKQRRAAFQERAFALGNGRHWLISFGRLRLSNQGRQKSKHCGSVLQFKFEAELGLNLRVPPPTVAGAGQAAFNGTGYGLKVVSKITFEERVALAAREK